MKKGKNAVSSHVFANLFFYQSSDQSSIGHNIASDVKTNLRLVATLQAIVTNFVTLQSLSGLVKKKDRLQHYFADLL